MVGFEDLEDDIELPQLNIHQVEEPRKLSRLKKGIRNDENNIKIANGIDTPESEARGGSIAAVLNDEANEPEVSLSEDEEGELGDHEQKSPAVSEDAKKEGNGAEIWDEEDEIEQYFKEKSENGIAEDSLNYSSGSDSDEEFDGGIAPVQMGDNPSLEDLNAETQRILRETAARDRLGKGQKIEIKPLTGIVAKLKQRRALAISRAPKPGFNSAAPSFDDIFAEATAAIAVQPENAEKETDAPSEEAQPAESEQNQEKDAPAPEEENLDLGLEVLSDEEDGGLNEVVVDLPNPNRVEEPKASPLAAYNPFENNTIPDEFEDEVLIDDGLNDDDESDTESERSWEVRKEEEKDGDEEVQGAATSPENSEGEEDGVDEESVDIEINEDEEIIKEDSNKENIAMPEAAPGTEGPAAAGPSAFAKMLAASEAVPERVQKLQKRFLDTEAELSDEDGAAAVSDDEDENNLDDNGELADLITHEKTKLKDIRATEELHIQWARQKEAQDLQKVIKGLNNGFRRPGLNGLDDGLDDLNGRWRRARMDGDDEYDGIPGAFNFPLGFANNGCADEEDCEDEIMLKRAQQQRLLANSQDITSPGAVPLDEDSQAIFGLLRSASESQQIGPMAPPAIPPPSRLAMDLAGGKKLRRGPSFVGRQTAVVRNQSGNGIGLGSSRSFVFGRSENSNSAMAPEGGLPGSNSDSQPQQPTGPVSFANLRQMAGIPGGSQAEETSKKKRKGGPTLVEKLKRQGSSSLHNSQDSLNAVSAVCQDILGASKRGRR